MNAFLEQHVEVVGALASVFGLLLTLALGTIRGWRHKICFNYRAERDIAQAALKEEFQEQTISYIDSVAQATETDGAPLSEIVVRTDYEDTVEQLAKILRRKNRLMRHYSWLDRLSISAFAGSWFAIVLCVLALIAFVTTPKGWLIVLWAVCLGLMLLVVMICVSVMIYLDGRFFGVVNSIVAAAGSTDEAE